MSEETLTFHSDEEVLAHVKKENNEIARLQEELKAKSFETFKDKIIEISTRQKNVKDLLSSFVEQRTLNKAREMVLEMKKKGEI